MIIAYEWISPIWWSCSLIRAHSHTRFDWECEILIVGVGVVRAWFPAQPFRTHNKESHMWKHRNCTICVCVHDECCLISTIDSFNPALGVCVSWLDLTIIFFNFKYLFILHFFFSFNFVPFCPYSQNYLQTIILSTCNVLGKSIHRNEWWRKKCEILSHLLRHIRVFKRGENGVNVWTSNDFFNLHLIEFLKTVYAAAAFIPFWNSKCFAIKIIWLGYAGA